MFPQRGGSAREPSALPLFPLRTVLFPGGLLSLKVFEQRYIEMTTACMRDGTPFGVCLITQGDEVARPGAPAARFAEIGTLANIVDFDMPHTGILHVVARGNARFRVQRHATSASGRVTAEVSPIAPEPARPLPERHAPLIRLLDLIAERIGVENFPAETHYGDASWVGYRLAELLPLPLTIKQSMLEINDAEVRLATLAQFLEKQGVLEAS
ncbi:MAG TPA: LON peptidase substrate-binding domain-containing protein [Casimicrobiaceae bacterium]|nr:LON peptidase substrate-binding domain-containing protein [Casimicrobiaceae bacterium]